MKKLIIILLGLLAIGIISYFCFLDKVGNIKDKILTDIKEVYHDKGMDWVKPKLKGEGIYSTRTVVLEGEAPDSSQRDEAKRVALLNENIFNVEDRTTLQISENQLKVADSNFPKEKETALEKKINPEIKSEVQPEVNSKIKSEAKPQVKEEIVQTSPNIDLVKDKDGKIILKGVVNNTQTLESIATKVYQLFGKENVSNELTVGDNVKELAKDDALLAIDELSAVNYGELHFVDNNLSFKGYLDKDSTKQKMLEEFKRDLSSDVHLSYDLVVPKKEIKEEKTTLVKEENTKVAKQEEPQKSAIIKTNPKIDLVKDKDGKIILKGVVNNTQTLEDIATKVYQLFGKENVSNELTVGDNVKELAKDDALLAIDELSAVNYGELHLVDNNLSFKGYLGKESIKQRVLEEFKKYLSSDVYFSHDLVVPKKEIKDEKTTVAKEETIKEKTTVVKQEETTEKNTTVAKQEEPQKSALAKMKSSLINIFKQMQITSDETKEKQDETSQKVAEQEKAKTDETKQEVVEQELAQTTAEKEKLSCQDEFSKILSEHKIHFEYNKAKISPSSYNILDNLVETMKKCPNSGIVIGGHTDSDGSDYYNMMLSQKRADAVKKYFENKGIKNSQLKAIGYGESHPVASNDTAESKSKNRRIELKVVDLDKLSEIKRPAMPKVVKIHKKTKIKKIKIVDKGVGYCQDRLDELLSQEKIYFSIDRKKVSPNSRKLVNQISQILKECPNTKVHINAYTDSIGSELDNLKLSKTKAQTLKEYLQRRGVKASRLIARGFGEADPIADNATTAGRSKNRRVEFILEESK